jgi:hypothetical protein
MVCGAILCGDPLDLRLGSAFTSSPELVLPNQRDPWVPEPLPRRFRGVHMPVSSLHVIGLPSYTIEVGFPLVPVKTIS